MMLDHLRLPPFSLDDAGIAFVERTMAGLDLDGLVGHLFVHILAGPLDGLPERIAKLRPAGITRMFSPDLDAEMGFLDRLQAEASVPLLVSFDLEGSRMSLPFGAEVPNPLALAAVDDEGATRVISALMAEEAAALGINWSFTPVLDINAAFRSPIVATRGFGADVGRIERHALIQIEEFQRRGIAATVKHWPGEGFDDRDQHLVTTINPLTREAWEASFGRLYRAAIKAGVMSVMSAHIAFPAYIRSLHPRAGEAAFHPASVSAGLNLTLLRGELGFNGLIVSDATPMAGLTAFMETAASKAEVIRQGCDIILFSDDPEGDHARVKAEIEAGSLPLVRVRDAVSRTLGFKAALKLHRRKPPALSERKSAIGSSANRAAAAAITRRAPTLVKDVKGLFPISPERHRRVMIVSGGIVSPLHPEPFRFALPDMLRAEGFKVTQFEPGMRIDPAEIDLMLYLLGEETLLTRGRIFLDWAKLTGHFGEAMRRYWHSIPTALISFGYPYYLYDAPRVPALINAYATMESMQAAVLDCMLGRAPFAGKSPVDPFCGLEDAHF